MLSDGTRGPEMRNIAAGEGVEVRDYHTLRTSRHPFHIPHLGNTYHQDRDGDTRTRIATD